MPRSACWWKRSTASGLRCPAEPWSSPCSSSEPRPSRSHPAGPSPVLRLGPPPANAPSWPAAASVATGGAALTCDYPAVALGTMVACPMFFRRSGLSELEGAHQALAQGQYDVAFALLETAARRPLGRADKGRYWLHLAEMYALYAEDGVESGLPALRTAIEMDPALASSPLYQALFWEFKAFHGGGVGDVKRGLRNVPLETDAAAAYHAASALLTVGAPKSAARRLRQVDPEPLPAYLRWRRWSLLGQCAEALGSWDEAAEAFEQAIEECPESEREPERLSLAGALLELGRTPEVLATLEQIDETRLMEEELAVQRYLSGRAHLDSGNPNQALGLLQEARALRTSDSDEQAYNVAFSTGQVLTALGRHEEATIAFGEALSLAPAEHKPFTQHEAAYALIEAEKLSEAEEMLAEAVADPSYVHRAEALADIADLRLKLGDFDGAESLALQALDMGASASACLCLGNIAYEYFRLDEAVSWFEQAVGASQTGDPVWLSAQQLLADVYAQLGPSKAEQTLRCSRLALEYTDANSEWYLPLQRCAADAHALLGGNDRSLN